MNRTTKQLKLVFLMSLILFSSSIFSQKIEWGKTFKEKSSYTPFIQGESGNSFFTLAVVKSDMIFEKFDKSSKKRDFKTTIEIPKKHSFEGSVSTPNSIVIFLSYYDKKEDVSVIYANSYSLNDGKNIKKNIEILSIPVEKKRRRGTFTVFRSKDNTKILLDHEAYYKKQKKYRERFILLDDNLKKLTEKEEATDKSESKTYALTGMTIDNDGSIYFIKNYYEGKTVFTTYDANKDFEKWEEPLELSKLGLPINSIIFNTTFTFTKQGDFVLVGYYSKGDEKVKSKKSTTVGTSLALNNARYKTLDGCFYLKIDRKSKEIVSKKVNEFSKEFHEQFKTAKQEKKGKEGQASSSFGKMDLYAKDDGGVIGVGEIYMYFRSTDKNGNTIGETFLFLDLVCIDLSPDGDLLSANRIPKNQKFAWQSFGGYLMHNSTGRWSIFVTSTKGLDYMSYFAQLTKDKFYIVYNDNPKNIALKKDNDKLKVFKKPKKGILTLYTIDLKTGKKEKSAFLDGKDFETTPEPYTAYQKDQNSDLIILASKGKNFKYGIMKSTSGSASKSKK